MKPSALPPLACAEDEIEQATSVSLSELRDPAADEDRVQKAEYLVCIGVCTRARHHAAPPPWPQAAAGDSRSRPRPTTRFAQLSARRARVRRLGLRAHQRRWRL